jgi:hypothetical protein
MDHLKCTIIITIIKISHEIVKIIIIHCDPFVTSLLFELNLIMTNPVRYALVILLILIRTNHRILLCEI